MVRNSSGGKGNRAQAKKNSAQNSNRGSLITAASVRMSHDPDEVYAVVTRMLGGKMMVVMGIDQRYRKCIIRGRFSGRSKRQNLVSVGTWVLVGDRPWSTSLAGGICGGSGSATHKEGGATMPVSSMRDCDLLEVYQANEQMVLRSALQLPWHVLGQFENQQALTTETANGKESRTEDVIFSHDFDSHREELLLSQLALRKKQVPSGDNEVSKSETEAETDERGLKCIAFATETIDINDI